MTEKRGIERLLRQDRLPHIFCSGCGIGPAMGGLLKAIDRTGLDPDRTALVSGIGCSARVAGYVRLDSFHTTHGRAIPFATGLKLGNPDLNVVVFSGDGDLVAIGGNHLIHAARRNISLTVICVNNFIYGMTGGQAGPTVPIDARTTTSPYGNVEPPFNLPHLASACGASYVARWTVLHIRQLIKAISEALVRPGFSFVEVIAPCPTQFGRMNRQARGLDIMRYYREKSIVKNGADPREADIELDGSILVGKFIDTERPTLHDGLRQIIEKAGGHA